MSDDAQPAAPAPPSAEAAAPRLLAFPDTAERRLRRALRDLDAAFADQRSAIAAFRASLDALGGAVLRLDASAQGLGVALEGASAETARTRTAARDLAATAEALDQATRH